VEKLLTIKQLSELIQVSQKTIYQWTHIGFIPHYKFPKGVRFRENEVEKWLQNRLKKGRRKYHVDFQLSIANK
jgi:excisionase family DNA binding protein